MTTGRKDNREVQEALKAKGNDPDLSTAEWVQNPDRAEAFQEANGLKATGHWITRQPRSSESKWLSPWIRR